jgi:hypothetical protein
MGTPFPNPIRFGRRVVGNDLVFNQPPNISISRVGVSFQLVAGSGRHYGERISLRMDRGVADFSLDEAPVT